LAGWNALTTAISVNWPFGKNRHIELDKGFWELGRIDEPSLNSSGRKTGHNFSDARVFAAEELLFF
jgi:hypothetical protein